jgi:transposase InsO family protein
MWLYFRLFVFGLQILGRSRRDLILENLVLRQQLAVYERVPRRAPLRPADRRFWSTVARGWVGWRRHVHLVEPATVVRWHHTAWRRYWHWKSRDPRRGRPRIDAETRALIDRLATDNPRWGAQRIVYELRTLGIDVSRATVNRYRPSPTPSPSWRTFLRLQAPHIWAADFFTVQTLTFRTLYVFFVISHDRRQIVHWNVTAHPTAPWVWQQIIQATPWNTHHHFLIRDRDTSYGGNFIPKAAGLGIRTILTPVHAPKANAIAERVIGTLRRECLDHVVIFGERHLRGLLREYVPHYNGTRPHRALDGETPDGPRTMPIPIGHRQLVAHPILGGLDHAYHWGAA